MSQGIYIVVQKPGARTLPEEVETSSGTARRAAGRTPELAGTQVRLTAAALSSAETAALSEVMIEGVRQGITATAGTKACPLRVAAAVEAA